MSVAGLAVPFETFVQEVPPWEVRSSCADTGALPPLAPVQERVAVVELNEERESIPATRVPAGAWKSAVTTVLLFIVTIHVGDVPLHAPPQSMKGCWVI